MNKRQVVLLWIIALILGAAAYSAWSGKSKTFESKTKRARGETLVSDLPVEQVAKIQITGAKESTTLVLKDGKWTVANRDGYAAKPNDVNEFLGQLADAKVTQGIEAEESFAPRFGMDSKAAEDKDRGLNVVMSNEAGSELGHFTFGKNLEAAGDPMSAMMGGGGGATGRFIRNHADSSGVYVTKEIFPVLNADPKSWLDPKFVQVEKISAIAVSPPAKPEEVAWKMTRADENAEFSLEGAKPGEELDPAVTGPLKTLLSYARFEDVVSAETAASTGQATDKRLFKIDTVEGFHYTITAMPVNPPKPEEGKEAAPAIPDDTMLVTIDVSADIAAERKKDDKESPEDVKAKDAAFTERKTALEKKLAAEKSLAGRVYKINLSAIDPLLKDRAGVIKKPEPAPAPAAAAPPNPLAPGGFPGRGPTMAPQPARPPQAPPRRPVEAVTPPIAIPPQEERPAPPQEAPPQEAPKEAPPEPAEGQ
ncbi:DUF4340 domain-containing protein [Luteolibacter sp. Populi]|uniref:DUF4340 domain-containing protein n=1 Tax=Luteolibacter sp. Populi TaxID=3230487 RepID=UPI0034666A15